MHVSHHCPDEAPSESGDAVLSLYGRFTPLLKGAPGEIGDELELDKVEMDGTAGISGWVSVSSALGKGLSPDKSCPGSPRARLASRALE